MVERKNPLDSDLTTGGFVDTSCDGSVRSLAESIEQLVVLTYKKSMSTENDGERSYKYIPMSNLGRGLEEDLREDMLNILCMDEHPGPAWWKKLRKAKVSARLKKKAFD